MQKTLKILQKTINSAKVRIRIPTQPQKSAAFLFNNNEQFKMEIKKQTHL